MISSLSISLYRLMMRAYPEAFRRQYGDAVDQAFRDGVRNAVEKHGALGLAVLWFNIVPDFIFSSAELLLAKAGDFLKWRFRLQWVVACTLGFALSRVMLLIGLEFYREFEARGVLWGVLVTCFFMAIRLASLGWLQTRVLAGRIVRQKEWVIYGVAGALLATVGVRLLLLLGVAGPYQPDLPSTGQGPLASLMHVLIIDVLPNAPMAILGASIGALQSSAIRNDAVTRYQWMKACAVGYFLSGVAGGFAVPYPVISVTEVILTSVAAGAALGLLTCGPLERILLSAGGQSSEKSSPIDA